MDVRSPIIEKSADELLRDARGGSTMALGELLEGCRQYLLLIANQEFAPALKPKVAPSDVVQETFVEAQQDFPRFEGESACEFRAWLRQILFHNLANARRHFTQTAKRDLNRELSLDDSEFGFRGDYVPDRGSSPSQQAIRNEAEERLLCAMQELSDTDQNVLWLRHRDQLAFREIGVRMGRSADAARMLWFRAFERLAAKLDKNHG